jgi:transposase-like protein
VTIRGSRVTRRAFDVAIGVDAYGDHELLGIWRRPARLAGAEQWLPMLDELHFRGIDSIEFIAAGEYEGLAQAALIHWAQAKVRPGVEILVENSLRPED